MTQNQFPFFKDLCLPFHQKQAGFLQHGAPVSRDEATVTAAWSISLSPDASRQIRIAAEDLQAFLKSGAGITLPILHGTEPDRPVIDLGVDRARATPESFRITCTADRIAVEGADDNGAMQGVFHLQNLLRFRGRASVPPDTIERSPWLQTRIFRSPMAFYYGEELQQVDSAYPDAYLLELARHGFNGIWLRGILRDLVRCRHFPEFGQQSEPLLGSLNGLIRRASDYGIKVYFYFCEPLGVDADSDFTSQHPDVLGEYHESSGQYALCTSTPKIKDFLRDGFHDLFAAAPGLGGVIMITASEHHHHCYSHADLRSAVTEGPLGPAIACPRCRKRTPQDVVSEILRLACNGIHTVDPTAKVMAWNWSWSMYEDDPQTALIRSLPDDVIVVAGVERGGTKRTLDREHPCDEYSLSYVGPSERFHGAAAAAAASGREVYAKLQIGNTHEIATVPSFPVLENVARKFLALRQYNVSGAVECWNFGNFLSHNTEVANELSWDPLPDSVDSLLIKVASRDFGAAAAQRCVAAWKGFSRAARDCYPMDMTFVYWAPVNFGGAHPFFYEPVDRHMAVPWLLPDEVEYNVSFELLQYAEFGDRISDYCSNLGVDFVIRALDAFCRSWGDGIRLLQEARGSVPAALQDNIDAEIVTADAVRSQVLSTRLFTEFIQLRDKRLELPPDHETHQEILQRMETLCRRELENSRVLKKLCGQDPRLGFHGEAMGYLYTPEKIQRKIKLLKATIADMVAARDSATDATAPPPSNH